MAAQAKKAPLVPGAVWRRLRLWSGLVLFAYASTHLLNHAFGIRSLQTMSDASEWLLEPWQTLPGLVLLYGAGLVHVLLGLEGLYRRRHLRIPLTEAVQITLGLSIPLLLLYHAASIRIGISLYDLEIGYPKVVYIYWVAADPVRLWQQMLLIVVVWIHGCIGLRAWLRSKRWYVRWMPTLTALATVIPLLGMLGFVNAGLDMRELARTDRAAIPQEVFDEPGSQQALDAVKVSRIVSNLTLGYIGILAAIWLARGLRSSYVGRFAAVRITYPGGRTISVPKGFTALEASRWAGIPHASVCGGRGRCSTCRVEIIKGGDTLTPPSEDEQRLLQRIGAPETVRLACQIRPQEDIEIVPLVAPTSSNVAQDQPGRRREVEVAAMFVDLRQSTRLADDNLPYDALFIVERFVSAVSAAVRQHGGMVINVAGDGVMSVFGTNLDKKVAARNGFLAALEVGERVASLNRDLEEVLPNPLRFGIGLHVGVAVVGLTIDGRMDGMPFLGDTGNVASRLETQTKAMGCVLVASREAIDLVHPGTHPVETVPVMVAGKQQPLAVMGFKDMDEVRRLLELETA